MRNLISIGQLDDEGHNMTFAGGSWKVSTRAIVVARGIKTGILYMTSSWKDTLAIVDAAVNSSFWHCRLRHMSEKGKKVLRAMVVARGTKIGILYMTSSCRDTLAAIDVAVNSNL